MREIAAVMLIALGPTLASANCLQSLNVKPDRLIPEFSVGGLTSQLGGRTCGAVETEREAIFIAQLATISEQTFVSFDAWSNARDNLIAHINKTQDDLTQAQAESANDELWAKLKNTTINVAGAGFTLLGCPTTFTGVGAVACAGGLSLSAYGLYDGLTADEFGARAEEIGEKLTELEQLLRDQVDVGQKILDERQQIYLERFESMCTAVQLHCL